MTTETTEVLEYGTNYHGKLSRVDGGGWQRIDRYVSKSDGREVYERRFAAGPADDSPMARDYYAGSGNCNYHPRCSCCWLGFSHTLDLHKREAVGDWNI